MELECGATEVKGLNTRPDPDREPPQIRLELSAHRLTPLPIGRTSGKAADPKSGNDVLA